MRVTKNGETLGPAIALEVLNSTVEDNHTSVRRDGRELYYVSPANEVMAVDIDMTRDAIDFGVARALFQVPFREAPIQRNVFDGPGVRERKPPHARVHVMPAARATATDDARHRGSDRSVLV